MKNKKGILTKNVLSLLIAVMGIILLVFVSVSIYNSFESPEEKNAKEFLNSLMGKMDNLEDGETGVFPMQGVEGWYLVGWDKELLREEVPDKCFFESCLCVCNLQKDGVGLEIISEVPEGKVKDLCQDNGFCRKVSSDSVTVKTEQLSGGYNGWPKNHHIKEIGLINLYPLQSLIEISVFKKENVFSISEYMVGSKSLSFEEFKMELEKMRMSDSYYYWEYDRRIDYEKREEIKFVNGKEIKEIKYEKYYYE